MPKKSKERIITPSVIEYAQRVLTPASWTNQADELIQASKKLEPGIRRYWLAGEKYIDHEKGIYNPPPTFKPKRLLQATYFMLVAYAIENYFKAVMIADNQSTYQSEILSTGKLPEVLRNHNLMKLAEKANLALTNTETSLLTRLSRNSIWQGRYPVPTSAIQLNNIVIYNGHPFFTAFLAPQDIDNLNDLIRRIKTLAKDKSLKKS